MDPLLIALTGLLISVIVPGGYLMLLRLPGVRNTTRLPLLLSLCAPVAAGYALFLQRSIGIVLSFAGTLGLILAFAYYLLRYSRLPSAGAAVGVGDPAPGFTLPDSLGRPVVLSEVLREGPAALVFFRGVW